MSLPAADVLNDWGVKNMEAEQEEIGRKSIEEECIVPSRPFSEEIEEISRKLAASEQRYLSVFENAVEGIYRCKPGGVFVCVNPAFAKMHGYSSPQEMLMDTAMAPEDLYVNRADEAKYKYFLHEYGSVKGIEIERYRKDGSKFWMLCYARAVTGGKGKTVCFEEGMALDVTEKKSLEDQLRQALKVEAVGQLVGGIAHDLNNLLTILISCGNLIKVKTDNDHRLKPYVEQIVTASEKAADLTRSLLSFSRKQRISLETRSVNGIVRNMVTLLRRLLPEDIDLETVVTEENPSAMADVTQLEQVLINLATNARDAMPHGGRLRIETQVTAVESEFIEKHGLSRNGEYVLISVSDSGIGIDESTREHIFQPYFTTKGVGKGTGLGLSTVSSIVKQHNGCITVHSQPGEGSVFNIYLPLVSIRPGSHGFIAEADIRSGKEVILLAEDDPGVRGLMAEVLQMHGYTTIEATDGESAIRAFFENRDTIDLVMLDAVMPKKSGKEVYEAIRGSRGKARIVFMSGYPGDIISDKGIEEGALEFVSKPLSPEKLLRKVREVLDNDIGGGR